MGQRRNVLKAFTATAVALFSAGVAFGAEYEWKNEGRANDWDWTDSRNFVVKGTSTEGRPSASDVVYIPDGLTVYARTSDGSFDAASSLERIHPKGRDAFVVFDIAEGEERTLGAAVNAWTGFVSGSKDAGGFIKTGAGALILSRNERNYYTTAEVREGVLKLAPNGTYFMEHLIVSNNATFFANPGGYTSVATLSGEGLVTNTVSQVFQLDEAGRMSSFNGVIAHGIYFYSGGSIDILSAENSLNNFTARYNYGKGTAGPVVGVAKFGTRSQKSSLGPYENVFVVDGGYFRYLGQGETTDKTLYFNSSKDAYPSYLDGGETGGLVFNGGLSFSAYNFMMYNMHFTGDNATPCVFNGAITPPSGRQDFTVYLTKSGKGVWRINDNNSYRDAIGGIAVKDGILQVASMDEAGKVCSLGYGTNLYAECSSKELDASKKVEYAFALGASGGDGEGLLEYVGNAPGRVTTRPFVLGGKGGFKASDGALRTADVKAMDAGAKQLVLDGDGLTNEVQDVADGAGVVCVVKRGSGTWYMSGSNTFSGTLEVQGGVLHVRDPARYRWYRFNIKKLHNKYDGKESIVDGNFMVWVMGLYDKDGNWLTAGMKEGGAGLNLLPGEAGNGSLWNTWEKKFEYETGTYGEVTNLFIDSTSNSSRFCMRSKNAAGVVLEPDPDAESTWGRVVVRLPDDAPDAVSWDFVQSGWYNWGSPYNVATWSLDGSVDGLRWDELTPTESARNLWTSSVTGAGNYSHFWYYGREKYVAGSASAHATGKQIAAVKQDPLPCLENVSAVSVAAGAALRADASADIEVKGLIVDAAGMGTIENFRFAEKGVIDVRNVAGAGNSVLLPGTYSNVRGFGNIANWTLKVDGVETFIAKVVASENGNGKCLTFVKPGMTIVIR